MYNHAPKNYDCPFCKIVKNEYGDGVLTKPEDIFYQDEGTIAFICSTQWPNNQGNALVVPNKHIENLYDISEEDLSEVYGTVKKVALAFKEVYKCAGVSSRQHNEPSGDQEVWHFHVHVFPRYDQDNLYALYEQFQETDPEMRKQYAARLRDYFKMKF